jgi:hypothetical protein
MRLAKQLPPWCAYGPTQLLPCIAAASGLQRAHLASPPQMILSCAHVQAVWCHTSSHAKHLQLCQLLRRDAVVVMASSCTSKQARPPNTPCSNNRKKNTSHAWSLLGRLLHVGAIIACIECMTQSTLASLRTASHDSQQKSAALAHTLTSQRTPVWHTAPGQHVHVMLCLSGRQTKDEM